MRIQIGSIEVVPEGTISPYRVTGYCGKARSEALRKWFMGEPTPGLEFWYAPACGGARKLSGPEETDVDADQVEYMWGTGRR
ncbi:MAG: hypothetical protein JW704_08400 [Anaerolineaceae bacterium]|nr:hypothetical protein [Anaerolineaceae bacterium]